MSTPVQQANNHGRLAVGVDDRMEVHALLRVVWVQLIGSTYSTVGSNNPHSSSIPPELLRSCLATAADMA